MSQHNFGTCTFQDGEFQVTDIQNDHGVIRVSGQHVRHPNSTLHNMRVDRLNSTSPDLRNAIRKIREKTSH